MLYMSYRNIDGGMLFEINKKIHHPWFWQVLSPGDKTLIGTFASAIYPLRNLPKQFVHHQHILPTNQPQKTPAPSPIHPFNSRSPPQHTCPKAAVCTLAVLNEKADALPVFPRPPHLDKGAGGSKPKDQRVRREDNRPEPRSTCAVCCLLRRGTRSGETKPPRG